MTLPFNREKPIDLGGGWTAVMKAWWTLGEAEDFRAWMEAQGEAGDPREFNRRLIVASTIRLCGPAGETIPVTEAMLNDLPAAWYGALATEVNDNNPLEAGPGASTGRSTTTPVVSRSARRRSGGSSS